MAPQVLCRSTHSSSWAGWATYQSLHTSRVLLPRQCSNLTRSPVGMASSRPLTGLLMRIPILPPCQGSHLPAEAGIGQPSSCNDWSVAGEEGPWWHTTTGKWPSRPSGEGDGSMLHVKYFVAFVPISKDNILQYGECRIEPSVKWLATTKHIPGSEAYLR